MKRIDIFLQQQRIKHVSKWIESNSIILDVGCFQGELLFKNSRRIRYGYGIDPLLEKKIVGDNIELYPGKFPQDLPSKIVALDAITALAVFEHLEAEEQTIFASKCYELLQNQGRVILTIPSQKVDGILKFLSFFKIIDGMSLEEHHGFNQKSTPQIFSASGFELEHSKSFQFGLNHLYVFKKNKN